MDKLTLLLQLILSLSILVVLHEGGHYLPAKWFKTRVEKFYLFFDPYFSLFKKKIGDTEWGIGWIPFGGYVKISGMIDESMDKEQMKQPPQPWEFRSKKAWQRFIIMVGGVTVNFILGILLFAMITFVWGESYIKNDDAKYGLAVDSLGLMLGLKDGDKILKVGNKPVERFNPRFISSEIIFNKAATLEVNREDSIINLDVPSDMVAALTTYKNQNKPLFSLRQKTLIEDVVDGLPASQAGITKDMKILSIQGQPVEYFHEFTRILKANSGKTLDFALLDQSKGDTLTKQVNITPEGTIGIKVQMNDIDLTTEKFGVVTSLGKGWVQSIDFLGKQIGAFKRMFTGEIKAKESLGSILTIATLFDKNWDWKVFWSITASLSLLLAFFNLLPIPALDGGYILFLLVEIITGRKPNDKFMEIANYIGFFLLIGLMIYGLGLDFGRFFG